MYDESPYKKKIKKTKKFNKRDYIQKSNKHKRGKNVKKSKCETKDIQVD